MDLLLLLLARGRVLPTCKVKQDQDGVWYARVYLGRDALGKVIRPYKQFESATSEEEAQALADMWFKSLTADGRVASVKLVSLLLEYIEQRKLGGISPNTARSYKLFTDYVKKYLGDKNAGDLRVIDFVKFEQKLLTAKDQGGQGLCRNSVSGVHDFLRGAYNHFVRAGIVENNPLLYVNRPNGERFEAQALDAASLEVLEGALVNAIVKPGSKFEFLVAFAAWLSLHTGMRCGEVLALRNCDVVNEAGYIHVCGTVIEEPGKKPYRRDSTKGKKSRNVAVTAYDLDRIKAFSVCLQGGFAACIAGTSEACCEGSNGDMRALACGASGGNVGKGKDPLISFDGEYLRPTDVSRRFSMFARGLGLPNGFTFHGLRHTHATLLLTRGVDLKTVSERLGHADEATTLRLYSHVLPGRDAYAAQVFSGVAGGVFDESGGVTMG